MKKFLFSLLLTIPFLTNAQQAVGHLTIFSEDGDKFYVVLNGEKQNTAAQTNLRIEDLPQPYYSARIIFADSALPPITQKNLQITDFNGTMMDVTYKIVKDKSGKTKLKPYSQIAVQPDFVAPSGTTVVRYGNPSGTTTTTTTTNAANANINVGGVSMSISVDDPFETTTTTTTTRSTTTRSTTVYDDQPAERTNCGMPMRNSDFISAKSTISNANFEDSKLSTARSIIANNCVTSDQVVEICRLFDFEQSKLTFAKEAYRKTTDQKNYFKVNNVFDFDTSKTELSNFIGH